ncbi:major tail protein [Staphylococcus chromogenes]|uniref:major tail protein n=1 Tax=Staphylococcus chromogenes TaxID=46126 RepID=UPI003CC82F8F
MTMHAFPQEIRQLIFNEVYNEHGVYAEKPRKQTNYVAVWFKRERKDGIPTCWINKSDVL